MRKSSGVIYIRRRYLVTAGLLVLAMLAGFAGNFAAKRGNSGGAGASAAAGAQAEETYIKLSLIHI